MTSAPPLATAQRSLGHPSRRYLLWPPLTSGCPATCTEEVSYLVEVEYADDQVPADLFDGRPARGGLDRWAPLLPQLVAPSPGEGGTPLVVLGSGVLGKDESREEFDGPVVCVSISAGFKDRGAGRGRGAPVAEWEAARTRLPASGLQE